MIPHPSDQSKASVTVNGFTKLDTVERARIGAALQNMRQGAPEPQPQSQLEEARPRRRGRRYLLFLPLCALAVGGIYLGTDNEIGKTGADTALAATPPPAPSASSGASEPGQQPTEIASAEAAIPAAKPAAKPAMPAGEPGSTAIALEASGTVVAGQVATVSSSITGRLAKIFVQEGERVTAGQPIALLDTKQAERSIRGAEARVRAAEASVAVAEARAAQTRTSLDRTNLLADRGLVPTHELQDVIALDGVSRAEVRAQREQIDIQREELELAKQIIDDATIRAPFSGVVTELNANLGEIISPLSSGGFTRTGVGTIVDFSSLLAEVDVSEQYLSKLHENQKVTLATSAFPDLKLDGHIKLITPNVDPATAAVKISITFDKPDERIFPGMRVDASFLEPDQTASVDGTEN